MTVNTELISIYPFNLARDILGSEEAAIKIYVPGIYAALATLTERESNVIRLRYTEKMTLKAIGQIHDVTQERTRQILAKALRKLRHPTRANMFKAVPYTEIRESASEHDRLKRAYELLVKAFEVCTAKRAEPGVIVPMAEMAATLQTPIDELNLSARSYNCLKRAGKNTLKDVCSMSERELYGIRNLGSKSASEIMNVIAEHGLCLRGQKEAVIMNRFKCPTCGGNQYTSADTAEGCIYCGHKELKKMETLEPEESEGLEC